MDKPLQFSVHDGRFFITDNKRTVEIPVQSLHKYWRNPQTYILLNHNITDCNSPETYKDCFERSKKLVNIFDKYCSKDDKIFEIGCNVGRNLHYLYEAGYKNLSGLDINQNALDLGKQYFPNTVANIPLYCSSIEDYILDIPLNSFDVVFTMAVLMHIHPSSMWVFAVISQITKKYLITAEQEGSVSERVFPYKFKDIFENLGMKQIFEEYAEWENKIDETGIIKLQYRVFKK